MLNCEDVLKRILGSEREDTGSRRGGVEEREREREREREEYLEVPLARLVHLRVLKDHLGCDILIEDCIQNNRQS